MKVLQNEMKKENHARWNVVMWGNAKDQMRIVVAAEGGQRPTKEE